MLVLGTAGHVDHGKSTFLKTLTGLDPDRLPEEKKRGMTIDLGFAWYDTSHGRVGIVDVPGHRRFVKNMVVGVGGYDAFLFIVAADDGWMPQSEEHLNVLSLLGVSRGILIVTKVDLVSDERAKAVQADAQKRLSTKLGTDIPAFSFTPGAPSKIEAIKKAIDGLAKTWPAADTGPGARLWVDRVFNPRGQGVVVTGTLREGQLTIGDKLRHWPGGEEVTVRNLESHFQHEDTVSPVSRTAVALTQIELKALARGHLLSRVPPLLTRQLDARVTFLEGRPKKNKRMGFHLGSLECNCLFIPLGSDSDLARLKFSKPIPVRLGEPFLLRLSGEEKTIGGGVILDPLARGASHSEARAALQGMALSALDAIKMEANWEGIVNHPPFGHHTIFPPAAVERALAAGEFQMIVPNGYVLKVEWEKARAVLLQILENPTREAVLLKKMAAAGTHKRIALAALGEALASKQVEKTPEGLSRVAADAPHPLEANLLKRLSTAGKPVPLAELETVPGSRDLVFKLAKKGKITALADQHYMDLDRYRIYCERVRDFLKSAGKATTIELKPLLDSPSRKHSVLILEKMDADRLTYLKEGVRKLLKN